MYSCHLTEKVFFVEAPAKTLGPIVSSCLTPCDLSFSPATYSGAKLRGVISGFVALPVTGAYRPARLFTQEADFRCPVLRRNDVSMSRSDSSLQNSYRISQNISEISVTRGVRISRVFEITKKRRSFLFWSKDLPTTPSK